MAIELLRAEAAVLGADAGLHGADALAVGVAGDHAGRAQIGPHPGQVVLLDAEQVDARAAGHLHRRHLVLVGDVGDGAQLGRRGQAAPHARHHAVGAVLLDVGVARSLMKRDCGSSFASPGQVEIR
jgi:hypothetical protein